MNQDKLEQAIIILMKERGITWCVWCEEWKDQSHVGVHTQR